MHISMMHRQEACLGVHIMLELLQKLFQCLSLVLMLAQPLSQKADCIRNGSCLGLLNQLLDCAEVNLFVAILD